MEHAWSCCHRNMCQLSWWLPNWSGFVSWGSLIQLLLLWLLFQIRKYHAWFCYHKLENGWTSSQKYLVLLLQRHRQLFRGQKRSCFGLKYWVLLTQIWLEKRQNFEQWSLVWQPSCRHSTNQHPVFVLIKVTRTHRMYSWLCRNVWHSWLYHS